jgi:aspartate carbamoyltransferase regulatory subunit
MSNDEMLTCGLCTNPIKDEELNQLRISNEEIKNIRDYQMKKTLDVNSNDIRGIIKCPNQNCSWINEDEHPIEPFKVQCPLCQTEFCSLCNQQYHYRTKCEQLPHIIQQWFLWCQTGSNIFFIFI